MATTRKMCVSARESPRRLPILCPHGLALKGVTRMVLRSLRFSGDPVLQACADGTHRMLMNEQGLAVVRIQTVLIELGYSVGPAGADGFFGAGTGTAVSLFKSHRGLSPADPVVGAGTMAKLDDLFTIEPAVLDPAFLEFSPYVAQRRLEPLAANVLAALVAAPLDSWRHMAARHALNALNSGELGGIVAGSRFGDLRDHVLRHADPIQPNGQTAAQWFDAQNMFFGVDATGNPRDFHASGATFTFRHAAGGSTGLIVLSDGLLRGKSHTTLASTGQRVQDRLDTTLLHELTHFRNQGNEAAILNTPDLDAATYVDPLRAAQWTAAGRPTAEVLLEFLQEIAARHVEWHVQQEVQGTPIGIAQLTPEQFAAAVVFYLGHFPGLFDHAQDGYVHDLGTRADAVVARLSQAALWLRRLGEFTFSDRPDQEAAVRQRLEKAASVCQFLASGGVTVDPPDPQGLYPLLRDFR
ncbi:peptidoglycan-binding domain-containing protein [Nonomuraea maritima]|uniref:peptidoglycan-binding domain-containing protein n=1 Tax=Nonomuraea maritima TaxID=683260 RepID=UPI0037102076